MRTRMSGLALAGAAALALGPGAASSAAVAAAGWTVHPGGAVTATAGKTTLRDTKTDTLLRCESARMSGTLKGGSGLHGTGIGSIRAAAFDCPSPIVPPVKLTARGLPWQLNLTSYDAGSGMSRGTISHLELHFSGPSCGAVVNGTNATTAGGVVAVSYASATGTLTILPAGGNLHWYHVSGCAGLVGDGDQATLSAAYAVSPAQVITGPST